MLIHISYYVSIRINTNITMLLLLIRIYYLCTLISQVVLLMTKRMIKAPFTISSKITILKLTITSPTNFLLSQGKFHIINHRTTIWLLRWIQMFTILYRQAIILITARYQYTRPRLQNNINACLRNANNRQLLVITMVLYKHFLSIPINFWLRFLEKLHA